MTISNLNCSLYKYNVRGLTTGRDCIWRKRKVYYCTLEAGKVLVVYLGCWK